MLPSLKYESVTPRNYSPISKQTQKSQEPPSYFEWTFVSEINIKIQKSLEVNDRTPYQFTRASI